MEIILSKKVWLRFWSKVQISESCWLWMKGKNRACYGQFSISGKKYRANRLAYMLTQGNIPPGYQVCHMCDNPSCVNPSHLFLGTHQDNIDDKMKKGRHYFSQPNTNSKLKTHCKHGHRLSDSNLMVYGKKRLCRICHNNHSLASQRKRHKI